MDRMDGASCFGGLVLFLFLFTIHPFLAPTKLLALGGLVLFLFLFTIHPFLTPTKPVDADILIADNCLVDYGLKNLSDEFRTKNYSLILIAGEQPLQESPLAAEYKTWFEL
ncbi:hypothetical protein ACFL0B_03010, partial [Thermodesulfobacteriota bacterium]